MTGRRLLRVVVANAAAMLGSHTALAQVATVSGNYWSAASCAGKSCAQSSVTVGFVPVGGEFLVGQSFTRAGAFSDGCPACKENNRPFFVPPGILMRLSDGVAGRGFGLGLAKFQVDGLDEDDVFGNDAHARNGDAGNAGDAGDGSTMSQAVASSGGASVQAIGAGVIVNTPLVAMAVTVNPEPSTIVLIATGLFGLVPLIGRRRRR